jgi:DNA-directed RNA polymerase subunit RPC12/RpoP
MTRRQLEKRLRTKPPSCVAGFRLKRAALPGDQLDAKLDPIKAKIGALIADPRDEPHSAWILRCNCGHGTGRLLGHRLSDYTDSPDCEDIFVSPLGFKCASCGVITELLDTDRHGYHACLGCSSKIRGKGRRSAYACRDCSGLEFTVLVAFLFWAGAIEVFLDEPDGAFEESFNEFLCYCSCAGCGRVSEPTQFGKL